MDNGCMGRPHSAHSSMAARKLARKIDIAAGLAKQQRTKVLVEANEAEESMVQSYRYTRNASCAIKVC